MKSLTPIATIRDLRKLKPSALQCILGGVALWLCVSTTYAADLRLGIARPPENGEKVLNMHLEYISDYQFTNLFNAHWNLGGHVNLSGYTSHAYTGMLWRKTIVGDLFIELGLGGAIHNGKLQANNKKGRALGSRLLFHESAALGYQLGEDHNIVLFINHMSNADIVLPNGGLTNIGIALGLKW